MEKPVFREQGTIELGKEFHPEFDGHISEKDDGVFISYIQSKAKGQGNFSRFLRQLKGKYNWIKIPTPSNTMRAIALSKGFKETREFFPEPFNEWGDILLWRKHGTSKEGKENEK